MATKERQRLVAFAKALDFSEDPGAGVDLEAESVESELLLEGGGLVSFFFTTSGSGGSTTLEA